MTPFIGGSLEAERTKLYATANAALVEALQKARAAASHAHDLAKVLEHEDAGILYWVLDHVEGAMRITPGFDAWMLAPLPTETSEQ